MNKKPLSMLLLSLAHWRFHVPLSHHMLCLHYNANSRQFSDENLPIPTFLTILLLFPLEGPASFPFHRLTILLAFFAILIVPQDMIKQTKLPMLSTNHLIFGRQSEGKWLIINSYAHHWTLSSSISPFHIEALSASRSMFST